MNLLPCYPIVVILPSRDSRLKKRRQSRTEHPTNESSYESHGPPASTRSLASCNAFSFELHGSDVQSVSVVSSTVIAWAGASLRPLTFPTHFPELPASATAHSW